VSGTPGVGKTSLVVHWAHGTRDAFGDGQLYVDLHGYDTGHPVPATEALTGFLTALGVHRTEIPPTLDQQAGRYRSELDGRRILVVLDNAASVAQVRPLLPGTATTSASRTTAARDQSSRSGQFGTCSTPSTRRGIPRWSSVSSSGSTSIGAFCHVTGRRKRRIAVVPTEVCCEFVDGHGPPWCCAQLTPTPVG
jgi:hypothetical protein